MKLGEVLRRANRLQQGRMFKIVATCLVALLALGGIVAYTVAVHVPPPAHAPQPAEAAPTEPAQAPAQTGNPPTTPGPPGAAGPTAAERTNQIISEILAAKQDPTSVSVGILLIAGLAVGVVWLGLGLTYLALAVLAVLVLLGVRLAGLGQGTAVLLVGTMALTASFAALMRLMGLWLSGGVGATVFCCAVWALLEGAVIRVCLDGQRYMDAGLGVLLLVAGGAVCLATSGGFVYWLIKCPRDRVAAVARNVLHESARMKISLIFIVMLVFGLASLPQLIVEKQSLHYKVQQFLAYGTGLTFWLIAILVLVFSVSSVAFEQRDKTIWQTMTKPVAAWEYVLGKWMGVVALAGVLLGVSASGVFLFTEYLRMQPAVGEREAYVADEGAGAASEDRFILETQVLTARETRGADPLELDLAQFDKNVQDRVDSELKQLRDAGQVISREDEQALRDKIRAELPKQVQLAYRSIQPNGAQVYYFSGLKAARESNSPILMRMKVNAGSNAPDALYRITVEVQNEGYRIVECPLGQMISLRPPMLPSVIDEDGVLVIKIHNRDVERGPAPPTTETISFPPDGLEVSYSAGSYRSNFVRVIAVLWVKLAFLAMLAIAASTFLSFPVACMVAFTTFLAAEGSKFILQSLESYQTSTQQGQVLIFNTIIDRIASAVGHLFKIYAGLRPTGRLVDGLMLSWADISWGVLTLGLCTAVLYAAGVLVFRRRELATYSGQ